MLPARKLKLIALAMLALAIVSIFVSAVWKKPPEKELRRTDTSFGTRDAGYKAFYYLLKKTTSSVGRWHFNPVYIHETGGTAWIVGPEQVREDTVREYRKWISNGNNLVIVHNGGRCSSGDCECGKLAVGLGLGSYAVSNLDEFDRERISGDAALTRGVGAFESGTLYYFDAPENGSEADYEVLFSVDGRPVVLKFRLRRGRIFVVSDRGFLTNKQIGSGDNSVLAYNLALLTATRGKIFFDEYANDLSLDRGVAYEFARPPFVWFSVQLILLTALAVAAGLVRLGKPVPRDKYSRRRPVEYIEAIGNILFKTRQNELALERLCRLYRRELSEYARVSSHVSDNELSTGAARIFNIKREVFMRYLNPPAGTAGSATALASFADALGRHRKELKNAAGRRFDSFKA